MRKLYFFLAFLTLSGSIVGLGLSHAHSASKGTKVAVDRDGDRKEGEVEEDGPDKAFAWRMKAWRDEHGNIPADGLYKARLQREANIAYWHKGGVQPMTDQWTSVGPTDISGRIMGIAVDPRNNQNLFIASAGGGLWHSINGGQTYAPVNDRWKSLAMGAVIMDPSNLNTMYAGTGEGAFNGDAIDGVGIYKSTDGGTTWNLLPATTTYTTTNAFAIHPTNGTILAGVRYGGIERSTDGGTTWTNVKPAQGCFDVHFSNTNPNNVIAELMDVDNSGNWYHHAVYSTDAGVTWNESSGLNALDFTSRIGLSYAASNNSIVYAYVGTYKGQPADDSNGQRGDVYKSTDGGHTYTLVSSPSGNGQAWYTIPIWVDPTDPAVIVIGGLNCYRSIDGGQTWTGISDWTQSTVSPHADQHFIVGDPGFNGTTNKTIYVGTDGGLYRTDHVYGVTSYAWVDLYNNQVSTQYYSASGDGPTGLIIGGLQDNGTRFSSTSGTTSIVEYGGDGGFTAVDATDPNYSYGEYVYLEIHQSTQANGGGNDIWTGIGDAGNGNLCNFISPFILSPSNPNVLWAGGYTLWRSTNVKAAIPTWTSVRPGNTTDQYGDPDPIASIAEAPSNNNIVWIGTDNGYIFKTTNATAATPTWTTINAPGTPTNPIPGRYIGRITIDKDNANIVYVALGGYNSNNLWKSVDGGSTWVTITGSGVTGLPAAPIHSIVRNPTNANYLYVGTEVGVFSSTDGGATWSASTYGPANVCTYELNFLNNSNNALIAATHGRGIWRTIVGSGIGVSSLKLNASAVNGGNGLIGTVTLAANAPTGGTLVSVASNSASATVPASVTVPAGTNTATFKIATLGVDTAKTVQISVNTSGVPVTQNLTLNPATMGGITLTPTSVEGGLASTVVVRLSGAAGPSGITVNVSSSASTAAPVPATLFLGANTTAKSFTITTTGVTASTYATIGAKIGSGPSYNAVLTVTPTTLQSLTVGPTTVPGGSYAAITMVVNGRTGPVGRNVLLTDSSGKAGLPTAVTMPANTHAYSFSVKTVPVDTQVTATLTGTTGSVSKTASLTITPATLLSVNLTPATVVGGNSASGAVHLNGAAGPSGLTITLTSGLTMAHVPATLSIPANGSTGTFTVTTTGVDAANYGFITAQIGSGAKVKGAISVNPAPLNAFTVSPTSVQGKHSVTGVVRLAGLAGPSGVVVTLASDNASVTVPTKVTVAAGASAASFTITTSAVTADVTANLTAKSGTVTEQTTLTVTP